MKSEYSVYRHTCPNGKVYIGITRQNPQERWRKGLGYRNNPHFYNAIKKFGWENIKHEVLMSGLSKKDACDYECLFILLSNSCDREYGYNHLIGGECGGSHSEQTKKLLSEIGKTKVGELNNFYGRKHSEESKRKMSEAKKMNPNTKANALIGGKATSELLSKPVIQFDLNGDFIAEYPNTTSASLKITNGKAKYSHIADVCNGKRKTWKGYVWKYKGDVV